MSDQFQVTVFVEDANPQVAEYTPPRKANVTIFATAEHEGLLARTAEIASGVAEQQLNRLLGRTTQASAPAAETEKATRTRRTQAQIAADKAAEQEAANAADLAKMTGNGRDQAAKVDPADEWGETPAAGSEVNESAADATVDDWDTGTAEAAQEEITDADLNSATQKRNQDLGDPTLIRDLIQSYKADPTDKTVFQLRQIPQEARQGYLDKLAALKKA